MFAASTLGVMHIMFVDESGDPGFPKDGNWAKFGGSKFYVRVGLIIHGWKWNAWNRRLVAFKRNRGLLWNDEIKASHIRNGRGCFSARTEVDRQLFLRDLSTLIGSNPDFSLLCVAVDKGAMTPAASGLRDNPAIISLERLLYLYNQFLDGKKDKAGIVVLDPTGDVADDNYRYIQSHLQSNSKEFRPLHIVEGTFFAKSHTSNLIQLVDVCSNIFYNKVSKGADAPEWLSISRRLWKGNGKKGVSGITRLP